MKSTSTADSGHFESLLGGKRFRVIRDQLVKLGSKVYLLPHVEIVVRRGTISAESDRHISGQHRRHGRDARGELHIRRRAMRSSDSAGPIYFDLVGREPHAMSGYRSARKEADAVEIGNRRLCVLSEDIIAFLFGFGYMDQNGRIEPVRLSTDGFKMPCRNRVRGMRCRRGNDQRVILPPLEKT